MERLTQDLLIDILSRLPIRSLLQASCVSKTWLTLTSDPTLSTLQLKRSYSTNDAILLTHHPYPHPQSQSQSQSFSCYRKLYFSENPNLDSPLFTKEIDLSFVPGFQECSLYVLGVCNGLLCLATLPPSYGAGTSDFPAVFPTMNPDPKSQELYIPIPMAKPIFVLNPITGEHRQLPDFEISDSVYPTYVKYGFGFDDCRKVFKVVVFLGKAGNDVMSEMQVYTIGVGGNNMWRREVGNFPKELFYSTPLILDTFLDGFLYWITSTHRLGYDDRTIIMSFHLGSEDFEIIQPPELIAARSYHQYRSFYALGVVDSSLCFLNVSEQNSLMELWIRNNENGTTSWIKHFSFHKDYFAPNPLRKIMFINNTKNGEHRIFWDKRLFIYNVENSTSTFTEIGGGVSELEGINNVEAFSFAGSLTSIDLQA